MSIFAERYLSRSQAVEGMVENWKIKHNQAMLVMDVEELVRECLDLSALCQHAWKSLWELLRRDPNADAVYEAEGPMKNALSNSLSVLESVQELIDQAQEKGYVIQNAEAFAASAQAIRETSAKIDTVYPHLNEALAEEVIAAFKRGECIPIEELIREAQSGNFPGH